MYSNNKNKKTHIQTYSHKEKQFYKTTRIILLLLKTIKTHYEEY